jgi:hypothetical protein
MMKHETDRLWAFSAEELELDDKRFVALHLSDCPECRDGLWAVELARKALSVARTASPTIDWGPTDSVVGTLVEKRMRQSNKPRWLFAGIGFAVLACASAALFLWPTARVPSSPPSEPPLVELPTPKPIRVELARGLTKIAATVEPVMAGEPLRSGDVLRTGVTGKAFVHLPDLSHVRLAGGTQVALTRADPDDVALTLNRGRVGVRASHESRKGFVVHAGDVAVRVVGTVFSVANSPEGVEVAVLEGVVSVGEDESKQTEVKAGQRLFLDARSRKARLGSVTAQVERELIEVQGIGEALSQAEQQSVVVPARGGVKPSTSLPRLSAAESKARLVSPGAPPPATESLVPEPERWDGPGTAFPSLAGGFTRGVPVRNEEAPTNSATQPTSDEAEWAQLPVPTIATTPVQSPTPNPPAENVRVQVAETPAPLPVVMKQTLEAVPSSGARLTEDGERVSPKRGRLEAKSLERLFLERAEASLEGGTCDRYLVGLAEIATDSNEAAQLARILRARCFERNLRPRQAMMEYVKYLEVFPSGRFAEEAATALGQ